jgi:hypothetical protein
MMEKARILITKALLAFALISIGFAMGKHSVNSGVQPDALPQTDGHVVAVYYLHSTFRCVTCNAIEKLTRDLLDSSYREELAEKKILWIEADFQANEALARQFEVMASCVVVAEMRDGTVIEYKRLDDVWTLMKDAAAFNRYVSEAIDGYLKKTGGKS